MFPFLLFFTVAVMRTASFLLQARLDIKTATVESFLLMGTALGISAIGFGITNTLDDKTPVPEVPGN
ncbi:unnamed protein product [Protopolystoma xenopodis]|uniref:Uncharacterized protein n=1 Tax=Protopolystoma xenopodis TaxID=117903 RepID=A0A448WNN3_9PLAT|nr:unnamed protein product [Protopolystoma xenopodis]